MGEIQDPKALSVGRTGSTSGVLWLLERSRRRRRTGGKTMQPVQQQVNPNRGVSGGDVATGDMLLVAHGKRLACEIHMCTERARRRSFYLHTYTLGGSLDT